MTTFDVPELRTRTLEFVEEHRVPERGAGVYRYATGCLEPTLYSSTYAAMTRALYGDLDALDEPGRKEWIAYLNRHQDDDGLYRDPVIFGEGWYEGDPLWCGRPHLTCHVITALACLGGVAERPLSFLEPWREPDAMRQWLEERDWGERVAWTGNEIMNVGTLLQYARDFHNDAAAGRSVLALLDWLSGNHLDPATGVWGDVDTADPVQRSHAVQAAYHWWPLFFYDRYPVPCVERALDTVLSTQNPVGGFGWGVHNPQSPEKSSACEDIDSIDPLARMSVDAFLQRHPRFKSSAGEDLDSIDPLAKMGAGQGYRANDIRASLAKAADWVLQNRMPDGGFVFVMDRPFEYGHPQLRGERNTGTMFPTWFRTLSLAIIGKALPEHPLRQIAWRFVRCPGFQFWNEEG